MGPRRRSWTFIGAVVHHLRLLGLIVATCLLGAALAIVVRPLTYQATALLNIDDRYSSAQGIDLSLQNGEVLSARYIEIATSRPVLVQACQTFSSNGRSCSPDNLARRVSANAVKGTSTIAINAQASDRATAAELANDVASAVLVQNRIDVDQLLKTTLDYLDSELKQLGDQIITEQGAIAQLDADPAPAARVAAASHQAQVTLLQSQYSAAYQKREDLLFTRYRLEGLISLFEPAVAAAKPVDPDPLLYVAAGLAIGALVGLLAVLILERFDDRLFDVDDLVDATGVAIGLALPSGKQRPGSGQAARSYALARAHLAARYPDLQCVLVAAASDRDLAYHVAGALGEAAVQAGLRVLVVDGEEEGIRTHGLLASSGNGNGSKPAAALKMVRSRRSQAPLPSPVPQLQFSAASAEGIYQLPDEAGDGYDLTVLAAPSPSSNPAGISLARSADVAILVGTARSTTFTEARRAAEALRRAGIEIVAGILVGGRVTQRVRQAWLEEEHILPTGAPDEAWLSRLRG